MIKVCPADIAYAESILLKPGHTFDEERLAFIYNFKTLDLQAVPGSGKTTVLLAKLLILEKHLPLKKNKGVLVLSHTNAAVDEIKERIGQYCPKLFSHPNFVGTIQSFVDNFLAIPAYLNEYKKKPIRIDDEIYEETIKRIFHFNRKDFGSQEKTDAIYYEKNFNVLFSFRLKFQNGEFVMIDSIGGELITIKTPKHKKEKYTDHQLKRISEWFIKTKLKVLEAGILCYDDAYLLAEVLLKKIPTYSSLLQSRFKYVFVDEMQDMGKHQFELLEKIFAGWQSNSFYQRLGDINQSIYSKTISSNEVWNQRSEKLFISGSHRLSKPNAKIVERLSITGSAVEGRMKDDNDDYLNIKPKLICYDVEKITEVIPLFSDIVKQLIDDKAITHTSKNKYEAVGWRKHHDHVDKICISDYWPSYKSTAKTKKIDYETLEDYLLFVETKSTIFNSHRKALLNALNKILYIEKVRDEYLRVFTVSKLIRHFKNLNEKEYSTLKLNLYNWSVGLNKNESEKVLLELREYIPKFLKCFNSNVRLSQKFINEASSNKAEIEVNSSLRYLDKNGIRVGIKSIHSVKGQTHTATLYLETFYDRGAGNYESQRLSNQIIGTPIKEYLDNYKGGSIEKIIQSARMAYVGFSRPTHLLCFAINNVRAKNLIDKIDKTEWDVIEIKKNDKVEDS